MNNPISVSISSKVLKFKPGGSPATFEVTVTNESDRFASFQLEIIAAGADDNLEFTWYKVSPAVSAKKPAGDSTKFNVLITDIPVPGFTGIMNLTVRVFSLELREEKKEIVRLIVEKGVGYNPLILALPVKKFQVYPGELIEIPVRVSNPDQLSNEVVLNFIGIEPTWLINGTKKRLHLSPGGVTEVIFTCQPPIGEKAPSQIYSFSIEATHFHGEPVSVGGTLEVLPLGYMQLNCHPLKQKIPAFGSWWINQQSNPAIYDLEFENISNLQTSASADIQFKPRQKCKYKFLPEIADLIPGERTEMQLEVSKERPWWGLSQKLILPVRGFLSDQRLDLRNDTQNLELRVLPIVPVWLQLLALLLLLLLLLWLLMPNEGHTGPVISVQLNGVADKVVSGSVDQTIRSWDIKNNKLSHRKVVGRTDKAVRIVQFRPVDNNLVAAGLENGEIGIWDLLKEGKNQIFKFDPGKDDRVFGLEFTKDGKYLFSGHGSGLVAQWNVERDLPGEKLVERRPVNQKIMDFAVYDLALVGSEFKNLAIGGRFNQLTLWDWNSNQLRRVDYPKGSQEDYLTSVDNADDNPDRLASADTQGNITVWNLRQCLQQSPVQSPVDQTSQEEAKTATPETKVPNFSPNMSNTTVNCQIIDQWPNSHGGKAVRSVALTADGCYLASGGDDGRVMLWSLTREGKRDRNFFEGQIVAKLPPKVNSVDLKLVEQNLIIVSGSDDYKVRLHTVKKPNSQCN